MTDHSAPNLDALCDPCRGRQIPRAVFRGYRLGTASTPGYPLGTLRVRNGFVRALIIFVRVTIIPRYPDKMLFPIPKGCQTVARG